MVTDHLLSAIVSTVPMDRQDLFLYPTVVQNVASMRLLESGHAGTYGVGVGHNTRTSHVLVGITTVLVRAAISTARRVLSV